jgi:large subunit ribosomal protein L15
VDLLALKSAGLVGQQVKRVKVIASGKIDKAVTVKGWLVTPGARAAIEAAGGRIEE